ncbi:retrovirus-related pol polyprotein from transposon TNT 1-94 [Tanacetum coccineum]
MSPINPLASKELVRNLPKLKFDQHLCDACKIGKQAHASHKAKNIVSTTRCLELLHMDLFGPSTASPLVDDDLDKEEAIKITEKKNQENDIVDETLEIEEIVNIKESKNHPLENVIGNLNQRTLRSQAQNQILRKKQTALAISTTEAEYVSTKKACQQALWMKQALIDYDLAYGVPTDGPYQINPPSPDDIILSIRIDREGQVCCILHEEEIDIFEYQVLTREIEPTLKPLEEIIQENVFCLEVIMEYLVNISKRRAFWSLNEDIFKITILKTNTPYSSRKIRRIRACTHQRSQRNKAQYPAKLPYDYTCLPFAFVWRPIIQMDPSDTDQSKSRVLDKLSIYVFIQKINTAYLLPLDTTYQSSGTETGILVFIQKQFLSFFRANPTDCLSLVTEYSEEEEAEAMAETMEQYMSKTRTDYGSGVARPKIEEKDSFELKGQFLKELRENTFSGSDNEDANEHIEKFLEIVDLFHVPNITVDQLMLRVFLISLTEAASSWLRNEPTGSIKTWEDLKTKFLNKYFPPGRTAKKMEKINNFQQEQDETLYQA